MSDEELIAELMKTPAPTGVTLGKCLDAWARHCKAMDVRMAEAEERRNDAKEHCL